jgi:hypothetical protein
MNSSRITSKPVGSPTALIRSNRMSLREKSRNVVVHEDPPHTLEMLWTLSMELGTNGIYLDTQAIREVLQCISLASIHSLAATHLDVQEGVSLTQASQNTVSPKSPSLLTHFYSGLVEKESLEFAGLCISRHPISQLQGVRVASVDDTAWLAGCAVQDRLVQRLSDGQDIASGTAELRSLLLAGNVLGLRAVRVCFSRMLNQAEVQRTLAAVLDPMHLREVDIPAAVTGIQLLTRLSQEGGEGPTLVGPLLKELGDSLERRMLLTLAWNSPSLEVISLFHRYSLPKLSPQEWFAAVSTMLSKQNEASCHWSGPFAAARMLEAVARHSALPRHMIDCCLQLSRPASVGTVHGVLEVSTQLALLRVLRLTAVGFPQGSLHHLTTIASTSPHWQLRLQAVTLALSALVGSEWLQLLGDRLQKEEDSRVRQQLYRLTTQWARKKNLKSAAHALLLGVLEQAWSEADPLAGHQRDTSLTLPYQLDAMRAACSLEAAAAANAAANATTPNSQQSPHSIGAESILSCGLRTRTRLLGMMESTAVAVRAAGMLAGINVLGSLPPATETYQHYWQSIQRALVWEPELQSRCIAVHVLTEGRSALRSGVTLETQKTNTHSLWEFVPLAAAPCWEALHQWEAEAFVRDADAQDQAKWEVQDASNLAADFWNGQVVCAICGRAPILCLAQGLLRNRQQGGSASAHGARGLWELAQRLIDNGFYADVLIAVLGAYFPNGLGTIGVEMQDTALQQVRHWRQEEIKVMEREQKQTASPSSSSLERLMTKRPKGGIASRASLALDAWMECAVALGVSRPVQQGEVRDVLASRQEGWRGRGREGWCRALCWDACLHGGRNMAALFPSPSKRHATLQTMMADTLEWPIVAAWAWIAHLHSDIPDGKDGKNGKEQASFPPTLAVGSSNWIRMFQWTVSTHRLGLLPSDGKMPFPPLSLLRQGLLARGGLHLSAHEVDSLLQQIIVCVEAQDYRQGSAACAALLLGECRWTSNSLLSQLVSAACGLRNKTPASPPPPSSPPPPGDPSKDQAKDIQGEELSQCEGLLWQVLAHWTGALPPPGCVSSVLAAFTGGNPLAALSLASFAVCEAGPLTTGGGDGPLDAAEVICQRMMEEEETIPSSLGELQDLDSTLDAEEVLALLNANIPLEPHPMAVVTTDMSEVTCCLIGVHLALQRAAKQAALLQGNRPLQLVNACRHAVLIARGSLERSVAASLLLQETLKGLLPPVESQASLLVQRLMGRVAGAAWHKRRSAILLCTAAHRAAQKSPNRVFTRALTWSLSDVSQGVVEAAIFACSAVPIRSTAAVGMLVQRLGEGEQGGPWGNRPLHRQWAALAIGQANLPQVPGCLEVLLQLLASDCDLNVQWSAVLALRRLNCSVEMVLSHVWKEHTRRATLQGTEPPSLRDPSLLHAAYRTCLSQAAKSLSVEEATSPEAWVDGMLEAGIEPVTFALHCAMVAAAFEIVVPKIRVISSPVTRK